MTVINGNTRTFGIEVETSIPQQSVGIYTGNTQIDRAPINWKGKSDCSIDAAYRHKGVEVVSPILTGEDGLVQVWYMGDYLKKIPATSNGSCGIHVHVGAKDLKNEDLANIVDVFKVYERAFYALNGASAIDRWGNSYCKRSATWRSTDYTYDRYQSLNCTNMGHRGKDTLEFRLFASIIEPAFMVTACSMAVAFITACTHGFVAPDADRIDMSTENVSRMFIRRFMSGKPNNTIVSGIDNTDTTKYLLAQSQKATI